jgi:hypothetical protein
VLAAFIIRVIALMMEVREREEDSQGCHHLYVDKYKQN